MAAAPVLPDVDLAMADLAIVAAFVVLALVVVEFEAADAAAQVSRSRRDVQTQWWFMLWTDVRSRMLDGGQKKNYCNDGLWASPAVMGYEQF